ncbi:hypothetical protein PO124_24740 [Bacillus licheniformis]|nr:hypothetical protein [Bacillus licheniformis]
MEILEDVPITLELIERCRHLKASATRLHSMILFKASREEGLAPSALASIDI